MHAAWWCPGRTTVVWIMAWRQMGLCSPWRSSLPNTLMPAGWILYMWTLEIMDHGHKSGKKKQTSDVTWILYIKCTWLIEWAVFHECIISNMWHSIISLPFLKAQKWLQRHYMGSAWILHLQLYEFLVVFISHILLNFPIQIRKYKISNEQCNLAVMFFKKTQICFITKDILGCTLIASLPAKVFAALLWY